MLKEKKEKENSSEPLDNKKSDDKKKSDVKVERKLNIDEFLENHPQTKGANNSYAAGFKVNWQLYEKRTLSERLSFEEWEKEYKKYLNREVK